MGTFKEFLEEKKKEKQAFEMKRTVKDFENFKQDLNESISSMKIENYDECLDYVLNYIEKESGSLRFEDIYYVLNDNSTDIEENVDAVINHIYEIVYDYLNDKGGIN